ncbi:MAG: hypothetical protein IJL89_02510, partial [Firmicutes bacterium]|nr:hypothetical protein [Bacillota bacterium]
MEKLNNILYYLILLALFGACAFFLHSRQLAVVFVVFLVFPFLSCIAAKYVSKRMSVTVSADGLWHEKGKQMQIEFSFRNKTVFPVLKCTVEFKVENNYFPNDITNTLDLSLPCGKQTVCLPLTPVLCGVMRVQVKNVTVKDALNIFGFKCKSANDCFFYVLPAPKDNITVPGTSELYSEDSLTSVKNINGTQPDG